MGTTVQRINFIEKEPLTITYRHLLLSGVVILLCLGSFYGIQWLRIRLMEKKVSAIRLEVTALKVERQARIKRQGSLDPETQRTMRRTLIDQIESSPQWSQVMRELSARTPNGLWLTSLKTAAEKEGDARSVSLEGMADEANAIAQFVRELSQSPRFISVVLKNSQQEKDKKGVLFSFGIEMRVLAEWGRGAR